MLWEQIGVMLLGGWELMTWQSELVHPNSLVEEEKKNPSLLIVIRSGHALVIMVKAGRSTDSFSLTKESPNIQPSVADGGLSTNGCLPVPKHHLTPTFKGFGVKQQEERWLDAQNRYAITHAESDIVVIMVMLQLKGFVQIFFKAHMRRPHMKKRRIRKDRKEKV